MVRVLAQFDDIKAAMAAVQALVAASFGVDDLALRALRPDGTSPNVPILERNHVFLGFVAGAIVGGIGGTVIGVTSDVNMTIGSAIAVAGGVGAALGAAIGIGSWTVRIDRSHVPHDATGFVAVVVVPEGRSEAAREVLMRVGGRDASPRLISA